MHTWIRTGKTWTKIYFDSGLYLHIYSTYQGSVENLKISRKQMGNDVNNQSINDNTTDQSLTPISQADVKMAIKYKNIMLFLGCFRNFKPHTSICRKILLNCFHSDVFFRYRYLFFFDDVSAEPTYLKKAKSRHLITC